MLKTSIFDNEFPQILIEDRDGRTKVIPLAAQVDSPYKNAGDTPAAARSKKVRRLLTRRTAPNAKGYTWTMGYNNVVGRWTGGADYGRFTGSSYNRSLKISDYVQDLLTATEHFIQVARKVAGLMSGVTWFEVSRAIFDLLYGQAPDRAEKYNLWIRSQIRGYVHGESFGLHVFSPRSRGKVRDKATAFYRSCPGSRVFCTLTFIAPVDDETGVSILNKFLTACRTFTPRLQYLWVAERQKKTTNNIHFHLILNKRLPVKKFNAMWVLQQYNAGLVGQDRYGQLISKKEIEERYTDGTIHKVFNPLDIRRVRSISGLSSYLTKYITKQEKADIFACQPWHCSRGVSRLFTKSTVSPSAFRYCCTFRNSKVDTQTGELFEVPVVRGQFFVMVYINNKKVPIDYLREMEQVNKWIISGERLTALPQCNDIEYTKYFLCKEDLPGLN